MSSRNTQPASPVLPGATLGILGGGQLGRMMAVAAKQMGYRVHVYARSADSPGGQLADVEVCGTFHDLASIRTFASEVDVLTIETENIPVDAFNTAAEIAVSFPGARTLATCQHRAREKQFLVDIGCPTCAFRVVRSLDELREACGELMPAVLKTTTGGYDGKGQAVIRSSADVEKAWDALNTKEAILEEWIEYDFEFSVVGIRTSTGELAAFPSIRNEHRNGILDVSISPSGLNDADNAAAISHVCQIMKELDSVGVLTVEFFYRSGELLVNEIAPRPHNSGHLTIEGHVTSQFEQHIRAICGLKVGSTQQISPVAMANLLGDEWESGTPRWQDALSLPNTKLHLYGKAIPKRNRKMGHLTSTAESPESAKREVLAARSSLNSCDAANDKIVASGHRVAPETERNSSGNHQERHSARGDSDDSAEHNGATAASKSG